MTLFLQSSGSIDECLEHSVFIKSSNLSRVAMAKASKIVSIVCTVDVQASQIDEMFLPVEIETKLFCELNPVELTAFKKLEIKSFYKIGK